MGARFRGNSLLRQNWIPSQLWSHLLVKTASDSTENGEIPIPLSLTFVKYRHSTGAVLKWIPEGLTVLTPIYKTQKNALHCMWTPNGLAVQQNTNKRHNQQLPLQKGSLLEKVLHRTVRLLFVVKRWCMNARNTRCIQKQRMVQVPFVTSFRVSFCELSSSPWAGLVYKTIDSRYTHRMSYKTGSPSKGVNPAIYATKIGQMFLTKGLLLNRTVFLSGWTVQKKSQLCIHQIIVWDNLRFLIFIATWVNKPA